MRKKLLIRSAIGLLGGIVVGVLISLLTSVGTGAARLYSEGLMERVKDAKIALLLQLLLSGLYGAICMGGTVVHDIESWPLLRACLIHYAICVLPYPPIALLLGWCRGAAELFLMIGIITVVYFLIWLILYLIYRAQVRELNLINQSRNPKEEDPNR